MTRCLICGLGEKLGKHDPHTGISNKTNPPHKFKNDNRPNSENEFGFHDTFVAKSHKENPF